MRFAQPAAWWLLLLLPSLMGLMRLRERRRRAFLRQFGEVGLLHQTPGRFPLLDKGWLHTSLVMLPFLCTILALADPRLSAGGPRLRTGMLDVVLLLDVSKSMAAEDYGTRSRLEYAREVAKRLLPALQGNRVGLVTFAGTSFRQADLTDDLRALDFILTHWVEVDAIRVGGSNLAQAIITGLALLPEETTRQPLMILFSDGGDGIEQAHDVLSKVTRRGIKIATFGLGGRQPATIPLYDTQNRFVGYMQAEGQVLTSSLNEAPLQQIASSTGGLYRRLVRGDEWQQLLTPHLVGTKALVQPGYPIFQGFLCFALLGYGAYMLWTRL